MQRHFILFTTFRIINFKIKMKKQLIIMQLYKFLIYFFILITFVYGNETSISDSNMLKMIGYINCIQNCFDKYYYNNKHKRYNYSIYEKNMYKILYSCSKNC